MKQVVTILRHVCELCIFCGVPFLLMEAIDQSASSASMRGPTAQAAQPPRTVEPVTPNAPFSPSQYENHAKDIEELPPQF